MKALNIILAIVFAVFGYLQFNDPDATKWVIVYAVVAALFLGAAFGYTNKWAVLAMLGICLGWMFVLGPGFMEWINDGMPSITSEMKTDEPHIEVVREFLGLLICFIALVPLYLHIRKLRK